MTQSEQIESLCKQLRGATDYARRLAVSMHKKFYPENDTWVELDDITGLLTQIDNMVTGLSRIVPPRENTKGFKRVLSVREQKEDMESIKRIQGRLKGPSVGELEMRRQLSVMFENQNENRTGIPENRCGCHKCNPQAQVMIVCPECGNKRCPKASDHELGCTGSNEPGQEGSVYQ